MRQPVTFGKYVLLERISVGGMAEVFKAKAFGIEGFEKIIAIKRILPSMAEDAEFIEMFIDEAKIVGQLSHANICQLFELGQIKSSHYIAMEYVWGKDLLQLQNRFRKQAEKMPLTMAVHIGIRMCDGLDYAHKKKDARGQPLSIVHRDVSPQNVLVSYEGEVKLIDFGIAKAATRSSRTQAGILKGKFGYMSPEQVRGLALDHRSDVFAVGTVLHELVTGERLFLAESDFSTLERVRNVSVDPPSKLRPDLPAAFDRIVMKALARDRAERYQSAGELKDDLLAYTAANPPPMTTQELGAWMQQAFAAELMRERGQLETYKSLTFESVSQGEMVTPTPAPASSLRVERPLDFVPNEFDTRPSQPPRHDDGNATRVDGPSPRGKGAAFADDGPTEIFGDPTGTTSEKVITAPDHSLGAEDTSITTAPDHPREEPPRRPRSPVPAEPLGGPNARAPSQLPLQPLGPESQVGLSTASDTVPGKGLNVPPPTPLAAPPLSSLVTPPPPKPLGSAPPWNRTMAVTGSRAPQWKVLARDGAIVFGIAVLVTGLMVSSRFVLGRPHPQAAAAEGVVVVASVDGQGGEVVLDGQVRGELEGRQPMLIEGLTKGAHTVVVRRPGAHDCEESVTVDSSRPQVVNCQLAPIQADARVILHVTPDEVTVQVDGQEISAAAAREPIFLTPAVQHTITVSKAGYVTQSRPLTLRPGETQDKQIALSPAEGATGFLTISSTPVAKILIDDVDTGKSTPITDASKLTVPAGLHQITLIAGKKRTTFPVEIKPGGTEAIIKQIP